MSAKKPFDFPDSLKSQLAATRAAFAREQLLSAKLTTMCREQGAEISRLRLLSAKLIISFGRLRIGSSLSDAIASGLRRGIERGLGGAP